MLKMTSANNKNHSKNSSVELLRIIAMLFIVLSHACVHSNFDLMSSSLTLNKLFVQWGVLGNLGVDIFVLISGYYLCHKKSNFQSIIRLLLQVWFYSLLLFLVCKFLFCYPYSFETYLQVFFPTVFQEYWFFTAYVVLVLLCPYINMLLGALDKHRLEQFIGVMLFLWVIIPSVTFYTMNMYGDVLAQFVLCYVIGAYFRLYPGQFLKNKGKRICLLVCSFGLLFASTVVLDYLGDRRYFFANRGTLFYGRNSFLIVACAVGLFASAIYGRVFHNKIINALGSCTFGIYLIHDNPAVRNVIWLQLLNNARYFTSPSLILRIIASTLLVFSASAFVEYLRITYLEHHIVGAANKLIAQVGMLRNKKKCPDRSN